MVDVAMFSALSAISAVIPTQRPKLMDNYMAIRVHSSTQQFVFNIHINFHVIDHELLNKSRRKRRDGKKASKKTSALSAISAGTPLSDQN